MPANSLKLRLTPEQQKQIHDATGKSVTELNIDLASTGGLSDNDLDKVAGGGAVAIKFTTTTHDKTLT